MYIKNLQGFHSIIMKTEQGDQMFDIYLRRTCQGLLEVVE